MKHYNESLGIGTSVALYGAAFALVSGIGWGAGELTDANYGDARAKEYVEQNGYTDVQIKDVDTVFVGVRGCDKNDSASYELSATSANGIDVDVMVCKGLFKGATLRQG